VTIRQLGERRREGTYHTGVQKTFRVSFCMGSEDYPIHKLNIYYPPPRTLFKKGPEQLTAQHTLFHHTERSLSNSAEE
jgi:hypothetical protein